MATGITITTMGMSTKKAKSLRTGFTTGTCAAAAAAAAVEACFGPVPERVTIMLPGQQQTVTLPVASVAVWPSANDKQIIDAAVIKDAGDDPDVTHNARIGAVVTVVKSPQNQVVIKGGNGVGVVTRAGLPVDKGEPAINPVPRKMISDEVLRRLPDHDAYTVTVEVYVKDGEALAKKTLNPRLGIVGGISILGTHGIVKPYSAKSYEQTIDICLKAAAAENSALVVLATGRRSERVAQYYWPDLAEQSFVQFADFFSYAIQAARRMGFDHLALSCFFGKLCKWAMNMAYTHARSGLIDFTRLSGWVAAAGCSSDFCAAIEQANNAREIFEMADPQVGRFVDVVGQKALKNAAGIAGAGVRVTILLWDFNEKLYQKWDTEDQ